MQSVDVFEQLEEGEKVLYNEKQTPLTVEDVGEDEVVVQGPKGGEYLLFVPENERIVLESQSGNRDYASRVEHLRTVGEWVRNGDGQWTHSKTGAQVELVQTDTGHWTVTVTGFDGELPDVPRYGFTEKRFARETAESFIADHPEG